MSALSQGLARESPTIVKSAIAGSSILSDSALSCKIVGTSKGFNKKNKSNHHNKKKSFASDSEESYSSTSHGSAKSNVIQSFGPSTPARTSMNNRSAKRRKGILRRAAFGSLIFEY